MSGTSASQKSCFEPVDRLTRHHRVLGGRVRIGLEVLPQVDDELGQELVVAPLVELSRGLLDARHHGLHPLELLGACVHQALAVQRVHLDRRLALLAAAAPGTLCRIDPALVVEREVPLRFVQSRVQQQAALTSLAARTPCSPPLVLDRELVGLAGELALLADLLLARAVAVDARRQQVAPVRGEPVVTGLDDLAVDREAALRPVVLDVHRLPPVIAALAVRALVPERLLEQLHHARRLVSAEWEAGLAVGPVLVESGRLLALEPAGGLRSRQLGGCARRRDVPHRRSPLFGAAPLNSFTSRFFVCCLSCERSAPVVMRPSLAMYSSAAS